MSASNDLPQMTQAEVVTLARGVCAASGIRWSDDHVEVLFVPATDPLNAPETPDQWLVFVTNPDLVGMDPDYSLVVIDDPDQGGVAPAGVLKGGEMSNLAEVTVRDRAAWRAWLEANRASSPGVWLVFFKKASGRSSVSYDEAVDECLCFGWIDSKVNGIDEHRSKQLITPRKPKSGWSKVNKAKVERFIAEGRMAAAGLAKIEAAKADGSWTALDAVESLTVPDDLRAALDANAEAARHFAAFSASTRKHLLAWIASAERPETRLARITKTVEMAAQNEKAQP